MTALGTVRLAFFASPPSAVALSKPTREKMQATTARPMPCRPTPLSESWSVSTLKPCLKRMTKARASDAGHRRTLEDQREDGRDPDVLVGDDPTQHRAEGEEEDRVDRTVVAERREELGAEDGEPAHPRHGDEEVRPDQGPSREHAGRSGRVPCRYRRTWSPRRKTAWRTGSGRRPRRAASPSRRRRPATCRAPALAKASGMISTAVMVGEIAATDWAKSAGKPEHVGPQPHHLLHWLQSMRLRGVVVMCSAPQCGPPRIRPGNSAWRWPARVASGAGYSGKDWSSSKRSS